MNDPQHDATQALLAAILMHVPFDGWSETSFRAACADAQISEPAARLHFPRGALDLAVAFHRAGDQAMLEAMQAADLSELKIREKIIFAVRTRLQAVADKEAVRRGSTLFALPQNTLEGAKLIWGTSDAIWQAIGDSSRDLNWYSKRTTLSAVYTSCVLYWLGDDSVNYQATWDFLERRIANVMQFESFKHKMRENPVFSRLSAGPSKIFSKIKAPSLSEVSSLPGQWRGRS